MGEDNPAGSLTFLFPTDFTDTHRLLTYGVQADLQSAFKKMSQPIWDLRICNPQQARMLLLD